MPLTKTQLLEEVSMWQARNEDTDSWYEKGIQLYKKLSDIDSFNYADYSLKLANLLLEKARTEKMQNGNMHMAEKLLKRVIDIKPEHSEIYYRLAFINEYHKKWEAVLFYANEALDQGITLDEEIKLSALMGYAYIKIGLKYRGKDQFEHAESLDINKKWNIFIEEYKELANQHIPLNRKEREERNDSVETALQKTHENLCCILSLYSRRNYLITSKDEIILTLKEAELLAFLDRNTGQPVKSSTILSHVWPELVIDNPNSTVVKRNISSLRSKIADAFETDSKQEWLPFLQNGYQLKFPVEIKIFKAVDFGRFSCR